MGITGSNIPKTTKSTNNDVKTRLFKIQESDSNSMVTDTEEPSSGVNDPDYLWHKKQKNEVILKEEEISESDIEQMQTREATNKKKDNSVVFQEDFQQFKDMNNYKMDRDKSGNPIFDNELKSQI